MTSWSTNSANSGVSGVASGPRTEQLSESASALNRTELATTAGVLRSLRAVAAEPVKKTRSWPPSESSTPAALPASSCTDPSGSSPDSTIFRTTASVRYAVWLAGFTIVGTPARNAGASFSRNPHTGKLKALICTATPRSGVQRCWPAKVPRLPSGSTAPSRTTVSSGSSRRALLA